MSDPTRWDMVDTLSGIILGVFAGIASLFGWFNGRIGKVHDRINEVNMRINANRDLMNQQAADIQVLEAHREASEQRFGRVDHMLTEINRKQDRQMDVLMELHKRQ